MEAAEAAPVSVAGGHWMRFEVADAPALAPNIIRNCLRLNFIVLAGQSLSPVILREVDEEWGYGWVKQILNIFIFG